MGFVPLSDDLTTIRTPLGRDQESGPRRAELAPSVIPPAFRSENIIGSALAMEWHPGKRPAEPDHDPLAVIGNTRYEFDHLDRFVGSESEAETRDIMRQIDREERDQEYLDRSGWAGFLAQLAAGTIDPTIVMPGGALVRSAKGGYALAKSAFKVGVSGAAAVAAQEGVLQSTQLTRTPEESFQNIGAATIFAGLLGAGVARWATSAERAAGIKAIDSIRDELKQAGGLDKTGGAASADTRQLDPRSMVPGIIGRNYDKARDALRKAGELPGVRDVPILRSAVGLVGKGASKVLGLPEWLIKGSGPLTRMAWSSSVAGKRAAFDLVESPLQFRDNEVGVPTARNGPAVETTARIAIDGTRFKLQNELDRLYKDYYYGAGKAPMFGKARARVDQARGLNGERLTYKAFGKEVRDAMISGDTHPIPEVEAAAKWIRKEVFDPWKEAAIRLKLLPEDVTVKTAESYFTRVYDKQKIIAQRPDFTKQVFNYLKQDQGNKAQIKDDLQANRNLRAERTKALRKIEKRLETIQRRQDDVESRLGERDIEARRAQGRVDKLADRQKNIIDEMTDLDEVIADLRDTVRDPELKAELQQLQRELADLKRADKPVTLDDLERADKDEEAGILTGPLRKAARIASGQAKAPKVPSLVAWMAQLGGIKDTGGDVLSSIGDRLKAPGLISANKGARDLDAWGEMLRDEFPQVFMERPSPDEVLKLIEDSVIGDHPGWWMTYKMKPDDLEALEQSALIQYTADRAGIDLKNPSDVAAMLRGDDPRTLADLEEQLSGMGEGVGQIGELKKASDAPGVLISHGPGYKHVGTFRIKEPRNMGREAADHVIVAGKGVKGEAIIIYDGTGAIHADGTGQRDYVAFPPEVVALLGTPGADLLIHHNHPNSRAFSALDVVQLSHPGVSVMWAHGNNGTVRYRASLPQVLRNAPPEKLKLAIGEGYEAAAAAARDPLQKLANAGAIGVDAANALHIHLISQALHNVGLIDYFSDFVASLPAGSGLAEMLQAATKAAQKAAEKHIDGKLLTEARGPGRSAGTVRHVGDMGIPSPFSAGPATRNLLPGGADPGGRAGGRAQAGRGGKPEQLTLFEPAGDIKSPEFQRWFGESKVVDEKGEPLVVSHHGSFDEKTDLPAGAMHFGTADAARQRAFGKYLDDALMAVETFQGEDGKWHWDDGQGNTSEDAGIDGWDDSDGALLAGRAELSRTLDDSQFDDGDLGSTTQAYLSIKNPKRMRDLGGANGEWGPAIEAAKSQGFDGIVYRNDYEDKGSDSFIAFSPTQIKSVHNKGTFDPDNPNIMAEPGDQITEWKLPKAAPGVISENDGLTIRSTETDGQFTAERDGKKIAEVNLSWRGPYATSITVNGPDRRSGVASKLYDAVEGVIGRKLVPSPLGLTDDAIAFWKKRLSKMEPEEKQALLAEMVAIGRAADVGKSAEKRAVQLGYREAGLSEPGDRILPPNRDRTIPIRIQRESMEETVNVRREAVQQLKDQIDKFRRDREGLDAKSGREGARKGEADLRLRDSVGGAKKKDGTVTRGRRGVLQDRSERLDTARELMSRAQQNIQQELDDLRLAAEEKLLAWEGKSAGDAQAALKRRKDADAERDRIGGLKAEAGIETGEKKRLTGADKAVDAAIRRITRSDRDKIDAELQTLADEIVDRILGSPDGRLPYDLPSGGPRVGPPSDKPPPRGPLAHRQFMIPDENIKDWLIADPEQIAHTYLGSIVPDVLLTERFGDTDMTQAFREINEEYAAKARNAESEEERNLLRAEQERVIGDLAAQRDRVRGTYNVTGDTVMRNAARIAGAAGSINTLADMGGSALSQITDFAGPVFMYGFGTVLKDGWAPFFKNLSQGGKGALGKAKRQYNAMGIAIDMHFNTRNLDEVGEQYHPRTKGERVLKGAAQGFMNVNLSSPASDMAKTIAAVVTGNEIFRATKAVAEGKGTAKQITNLAASSIDEEMAGRIWQSFQESGAVEDGVYLPNTADWSDAAARRAFEGAVSREVNIAVVTPGQEKALWLSHPVYKLLGQFKSFIASSTVRLMAANLQKRDAQTLQGLIASITLGMLGYKAYMTATGQETSDRWQDWVKEGVSRSGVLGWLDEGNAFASKFTRGQLDLYRAVGADKPLSRYASRGVLGALMGPTAGKIENLAQFTGALATGEYTSSDTRAARRLLPFQNLFYIRRLLNDVEAGLNDRFGVPGNKP